MAQNPFSKTNNFVKKPKRNTFDLSFQNNATFNFGTLYPVMCKEVIPGDSFRIEPTFALKFMPMVFPVQTRMNANLHFFYVRNRNLYKDWPDFISKNKAGLTPPYISIGLSEQERYSKMFGTGSLGDYLGVPSVLAGSEYGASTFVFTNPWQRCINRFFYRGTNQSQSHAGGVDYDFFDRQDIIDSLNRDAYITDSDGSNWRVSLLKNDVSSAPVDCINSGDVFGIYKIGNFTPDLIAQLSDYTGPLELTLSCVRDTTPEWITSFSNHREYLSQVLLQSVLFLFDLDSYSGSASVKPLIHYFSTLPSVHYYEQQGGQVGGLLRYDISWKVSRSEFLDFLQKRQEGHTYALCFASYWALYGIQDVGSVSPFGDGQAMTFASLVYTPDFIFRQNGSLTYLSQNSSNSQRDGYLSASSGSYNGVTYSFGTSVRSYDVTGITEVSVSSSPFVSKSSDSLASVPLSVLPFRAYESIYNAFYRDIRNNPYDPNGDGNYEYNKYIPTMEGGADTTTYELHRRNWEQDFLTTAVQSPQQGTAPLVGVTGDGTFRFQDESGQTFTAKAIVSDDGNEITGFTLEDSKMPVGNVQFLMDVASAGFTINDFRSVNSFQRWLETNMRKGLRYRDQIMAHYGVSVRYDELDMPEFIGGMSVPVTVNQVTQTTPTDGSPLGMYAGQASAIGKGRSITKYFDEHGFIMAIFSVTPVPNYSQLLPKYFLKNDALDYFFPEFGHIGYQPIFYNEVCPLQGYNAGGAAELQKVFGYQRAWYEYLASTDEVHGEFRTTLRNYLINRVFSQAPELSEEFLLVDPDQVNDVFAVTTEDTGDKILGQIYFKISAKRPIPLFGIPKIDG